MTAIGYSVRRYWRVGALRALVFAAAMALLVGTTFAGGRDDDDWDHKRNGRNFCLTVLHTDYPEGGEGRITTTVP